MSGRPLVVFPLVALMTLLVTAAQAEASPRAQRSPPGLDEGTSPVLDVGILCARWLVWRDPRACPSYGLGTRAARVANILLPDPLPELSVIPVQSPENGISSGIYAQVMQDHVPVYRHPIEATVGLPPVRRLGAGFVWVSVQGKTTYEGRDYYQINRDEYVPAEALSMYAPSAFQGVALAEQPERPFAWILRAVRPLLTPGGQDNADAPIYHRYQLVQIFATEHLDDQVWYLIGPDQWINQVFVGKVEVAAVPLGVEPGAAWIDVNLFEQTLAAYIGDRMVYATLVSSGLPGWNTPVGLFQVWHRSRQGKMSGAEGRPDYYFLEDVPWSLYFNRDVALHGAYWHDGFGYKHSHGCVNLALRDAKWLFEWAPDALWVQVKSGQDDISH